MSMPNRRWLLNLCSKDERTKLRVQRAQAKYRALNRENLRKRQRDWKRKQVAEGHYRKGGKYHAAAKRAYDKRLKAGYFKAYRRKAQARVLLVLPPARSKGLPDASSLSLPHQAPQAELRSEGVGKACRRISDESAEVRT